MQYEKSLPTAEAEPSPRHSPYKRVVNAVLAQAADDTRALRERLREHRYPMAFMVDAALWATSDEDRPFSFVWCCEMVGRDPGVTRKKMLGTINIQKLKEAMRV